MRRLSPDSPPAVHSLGVRELLVSYATERRRPHDVVDLVLERITARGQDSVWTSRCSGGELHQRAAELERIRRDRGTTAGMPLFGVPCAVKDNIDVAGLATTAGCPAFGYQPVGDAHCVRRLLDAGAIVVGKTNLDQFAAGLTGTSSPYGCPRSVLGGDLIAGGSSSGSAVAVAAGLVSFALGTDTAGSGRVPAAMNGIVGCKPTRGLVSTAGVVPACRSLDCVSVFTTDVSEVATVLDVICGVNPADPWSRPVGDQDSQNFAGRLRALVPTELDFERDTAMRESFDAAVARAGERLGELLPTTIAPLREAGELLYQGPWVAQRLVELGDFFARDPDDVLPATRARIEEGRRYSALDAFRAAHRLQELRHQTARLWRRAELLIMPTVPTTFTVDEATADPVRCSTVLGRFTQFANLLDLAALTVPTGLTTDGRPASVTLIGPAFSEPLLLAAATRLADPRTVNGTVGGLP